MAVNPIPTTSLISLPSVDSGVQNSKTPGRAESTEQFSDLIRGLLDKANAPHVEADAAVQQLMKGETDNVHSVVMSVVEADMSFRFMLELRNRLTEAYQEVMRMQV